MTMRRGPRKARYSPRLDRGQRSRINWRRGQMAFTMSISGKGDNSLPSDWSDVRLIQAPVDDSDVDRTIIRHFYLRGVAIYRETSAPAKADVGHIQLGLVLASDGPTAQAVLDDAAAQGVIRQFVPFSAPTQPSAFQFKVPKGWTLSRDSVYGLGSTGRRHLYICARVVQTAVDVFSSSDKVGLSLAGSYRYRVERNA